MAHRVIGVRILIRGAATAVIEHLPESVKLEGAVGVERMAVAAAGATLENDAHTLVEGASRAGRAAGRHRPTIDVEQLDRILLRLRQRPFVVGRQHVFNPRPKVGELLAPVLLPVEQELPLAGQVRELSEISPMGCARRRCFDFPKRCAPCRQESHG